MKYKKIFVQPLDKNIKNMYIYNGMIRYKKIKHIEKLLKNANSVTCFLTKKEKEVLQKKGFIFEEEFGLTKISKRRDKDEVEIW